MEALWLPDCDLLKTISYSLQSHVAWSFIKVLADEYMWCEKFWEMPLPPQMWGPLSNTESPDFW